MNSKSLGERIARQIVRAFYDDVHVVVFDGLLLESIQPANDTDLAQHLNLPPKLVRTCLQALKRDGFVQERSQRQAANAKKATIFLWSFSSERFARIFRYRMLMIRKRASALASQAIADETFICSSADCFYHTRSLSTIDAIAGCHRLGVTDFICEHCRSPLTKQARAASCNYEDLKSRINQELAQVETDVSQLVHLIAQERAEQAAQSDTAAAHPGPDAAGAAGSRPDAVQVHIESHDAIHAKIGAVLGAGPAAAGAGTARASAAPWESTPAGREPAAADGAGRDDKIDVVAFEEILRRQEMELNQAGNGNGDDGKVDDDEGSHAASADRHHHRHRHRHHDQVQPHPDLDSFMVVAGGQLVPLSSVTEEMAQQMTQDEYRHYEQILTSTDLYHDDEFDF